MKKLLILSIILFQSGLLFAQTHGQRQTQGEIPKFNAKNAAGIIKYDDEKMFKKLSIKDDAKKQNVSKALAKYNRIIDEIIFLNNPKFTKLEKEVNAQKKVAMVNKDQQAMMGIQEELRKELAPIKKQINNATKDLNQTLEKALSEKQYKKWLKYQASKKKALKPKSPASSNMSKGKGKGSRGGGGRGSGGKMGY